MQRQIGQLDLDPRHIARHLPVKAQPCAGGHIGQHRQDLWPPHALFGAGHAIGHPEKPDTGVGVGDAFGDQCHLGAGRRPGHQQEFNPIGNRAQRADKIMADARTEQGGQVKLHLHQRHPWRAKGDRMASLNDMLEPGMLVRHPGEPDWGLGQVQSNIGGRITVNFEHRGKVVIDGSRVFLTAIFDR